MSNAQEQLVSVLRTIIAECEDPWAAISRAIEAVACEPMRLRQVTVEEVPGPYAPNALSNNARMVARAR
ncbi:hypothetical protein [Methylobacterium soli]|jgi:hypothetical protein|uniref:Uncharacterized protein n=1 Tax=Methylobacterium soli TaxID=553447 RepID=A0A6L3T1I0_9HYPH|nr:hypothetical protein [Methylobacterium soli]KAB1079833.1 hypothetical protein F6X53_08690 [Methylobacterium soli]GJE41793.1 hypothetical protein AEGHOMDF_0959 [Methylobacterium soli]